MFLHNIIDNNKTLRFIITIFKYTIEYSFFVFCNCLHFEYFYYIIKIINSGGVEIERS